MSTASKKITPDDIQAKFRELEGEVDEAADQARDYALMGAAVTIGAIVLVAFVLGRRRGRKANTVVEIRRV